MEGRLLAFLVKQFLDRSSELSDSETKAALDLLRLQKTVDAMKGERRPSTNAKFFWDDVNSNPAISSESDGG